MTAGEREPALFDSVVARAPPLISSGNYGPALFGNTFGLGHTGPTSPGPSLRALRHVRKCARPRTKGLVEGARVARGPTTRPTPWRDGDDGHSVAPS